MRPHGHVHISRSKPQAQGVCDRCGRWFNHKDLMWQFDWVGARLQNLRILVCQPCRDKPQENIRTIVLPPDPMPIMNPRPESFPSDDNPISGIGWDALKQFSLWKALGNSTISGTLTGGGGPDAAFFGGGGLFQSTPTTTAIGSKLFSQSATLVPGSSLTGVNNVQVAWSNLAGNPTTPTNFGLSTPTQAYVINQAVVTAPIDQPFLGGGASTTVGLDGSNDGATWTNLATANTQGVKGEQVILTTAAVVFYAFHRVWVKGDGTHAVAIAAVQLSTPGPSSAQTGSELGA